MLLQTNSYIVPKDKRTEHARMMRRFRQILAKLGCDQFEVYEQVGANWSGGDSNGRFVQIMRFRDRKHQLSVQNLERSDPSAQTLITEFCELVNFPYQQQQGFFAVGFYNGVLPAVTARSAGTEPQAELPEAAPAELESPPLEGSPLHESMAVEEVIEEELPAPEHYPHAGENGGPHGEHTSSEAFLPTEEMDLSEQGEPLSEEELAQELTPAPVPPPAPVAPERGGLFRRAPRAPGK